MKKKYSKKRAIRIANLLMYDGIPKAWITSGKFFLHGRSGKFFRFRTRRKPKVWKNERIPGYPTR